MDSLAHLNAFISERLAAAAVEIFGAVEQTLLEHQREISQEIDHLRSLVLWPEVRLHRSAAHQLGHHCCGKEASGENQAPALSPEQQATLPVKEERGQSQREASCRLQCDAPVFPHSVKRGRKDLPSRLYGILHVEQTADVKAEPHGGGFTTSPSSRETEVHCGINVELCGLQQETLTDPLEIMDHTQKWHDEQQYHEQDWSPCQEHGDPDPIQIKVETFTSSCSQEETVREYKSERSVYVEPRFHIRSQTFHPTEEEKRDVEGEGSKLSRLTRVSRPFYPHCPAPQGFYDESAGGPVNGESFKEYPLPEVTRRRRTNPSLCHKEIVDVTLEGAVSGLTKERRHTCPICAKRFKESSHLKEHVRIHTGEKPYQCKQCGTNFRQSGALTLHTRIHTGERPYQCSDCGRRFNRKGDMESHMVTHTGERPHLCLVCGKSYRRKGNLNMHLKNHAEGRKDYTQPL